MDHNKQSQLTGTTGICKYKDNKIAAYSICGDDSMQSQLDFMIPEMRKRGFAGTFWINPDRGPVGVEGFCWQSRLDEWIEAAQNGCDFGNHTMNHLGAKDFEQADYEIGHCARTIWYFNPGQRLQLFLSGGSTTWNVKPPELLEILHKYHCVPGRGGGRGTNDISYHYATSTSATVEEVIGNVDAAITEGSWHYLGTHGVGPKAEWLGLDAEPFLSLLDYLVDKQDQVWVGTNTEVHKYIVERESAQVRDLRTSQFGIRFKLIADTDPLLYDYPLTLRTQVPSTWQACRVQQRRRDFTVPVKDGIAQYDVLPNVDKITLSQA